MSLENRIAAELRRGAHKEAAEEAIRGYGPQILGYLARVLGSPDEAADAFSFFSEQIWRGMAGFHRQSSVRVWAYRVAWSAARRVLEDGFRQRRERLATSMASKLAAEVLSRSPASVEREAAQLEQMRRALQPEERSLLVLRLDRRLSWREVAEIERQGGRPVDEPTLRKRFERIKEKLTRFARDDGLFD
jgi:RNA polymerase sigma-70 factor, ECF subfamily